jgi:hypothetical protein
MTARTSIARLADCAPVASPEWWAARTAPAISWVSPKRRRWITVAEIVLPDPPNEAELEAIWRRNMARRDADAAKNGEPRDPTEFYRGRKP